MTTDQDSAGAPGPATASAPGGVLVVGEALVDILQRAGEADVERVGGSPANVAAGLARLGHRTDFATSLGDDERGERVRAHLASRDVKVTDDSIRPGPTSTATATIDLEGAATYTFDLHWQPGSCAPTDRHGHVHTGSLATVVEPGASSALAGLRRARELGATTSYDPNVRPAVTPDGAQARELVERVVALSDVVKASNEDVRFLYGTDATYAQVVDRWVALGARIVVLTLGKEGVLWATSAEGTTDGCSTLLAPDVPVVDTVGAGDSFMAGLLSGLLDAGLLGRGGRERLATATAADVRAAVERGLATCAVTLQHAGAWAPTRAELA